jgi:hypothetical protein
MTLNIKMTTSNLRTTDAHKNPVCVSNKYIDGFYLELDFFRKKKQRIDKKTDPKIILKTLLEMVFL